MESKISRVSKLPPVQKNETINTEQAKEVNSKSIFEQSAKTTKGKGLGVGEIPLGIQKKIDSGKVLQSLIDKFKQIAEALKPKEEAPVAEAPVAEVPAAKAPVVDVPVEEVPVAEAPVAEAPVEEVPAAKAPVVDVPVEEVPVEEVPVEDSPA